MASKCIVNGKHPIVIRIDPDVYDRLRYLAAKKNTTVNKIMATAAEEIAEKVKLPSDFTGK